jgi:hypothetical protein
MKHQVWFGRMTHGTFSIGGDSNPLVIVHSVDHVERMEEDKVDDYMTEHGYDSWLIPKLFKKYGEIVYDDSFKLF